MAKVATKALMGQSLLEQGYTHGLGKISKDIAVKAPVFSFAKLSDVDIVLGPEMKSTGEVMGRDTVFERALHKAFLASGMVVPQLVTIADKDKDEAMSLVKRFHHLGFSFAATEGTAKMMMKSNIPVQVVPRIGESDRDLLTMIRERKCDLVINTISRGRNVESDGFKMRRVAVERGIACLTSRDTVAALLRTLERQVFTLEPI